MSIVDRAKKTGGNIAASGKRQARRAQLEIKNRQTERKLGHEYARIGRALYPLIEAGELATDNGDVKAAVSNIQALVAEAESRQAEIERVKHPDEPAPGEEPAAETESEKSPAAGD